MKEEFEGSLIFMTDPICSWCWGTLPEVFRLQEIFSERLSFDLRCAGLQVGSQKPLSEEHIANLQILWRNVAETTGQKFAFSLPADADFIYHSELACRALQIARRALGAEPWQVFHNMQQAFYVDCRNLSDLGILFELVSGTGIDEETFMDQMTSNDIVETTRMEFDWCSDLGIQALPSILLDLGTGPKLVAGGYATADVLAPEISGRLNTH